MHSVVGMRRAGELGDDPAVGEMIVKDDWVASAIGLADAAEASPERSDPNWSQDRCAGCLVKDLIAFVHHLNVLSCPDDAVRIGRMAIARDTGIRDTVKIKDGERA